MDYRSFQVRKLGLIRTLHPGSSRQILRHQLPKALQHQDQNLHLKHRRSCRRLDPMHPMHRLDRLDQLLNLLVLLHQLLGRPHRLMDRQDGLGWMTGRLG